MVEVEWFRRLGPTAPPRFPAELDRVASEQCGLVTRAQCLNAGLSSKAVEVRLANGRWRRVQHGVYLTAPGRDDWWTAAMAAHPACGPDAAWSHHTAAFVWGLIHSPPRQLELSVPRDFAVRPPRGARVSRCRDLDAGRPAVVALGHDRGGHHPGPRGGRRRRRELRPAGRAFQRHRTTERSLAIRLAARSRLPRRALLREVLGDVAGGAESAMELRYLRDVERAHGLPRASDNTPAIREARSAERHDVAYAEQRVLVELDGELGHEGRGARIRDGRRDRRAPPRVG